MTGREFMDWAEGYYGPYPAGQRNDVWEYIKPWDANYLDGLKKALMQNFTSQFKTPPDIAAMNKVYQFAVAECDKITGHEPRPAPTMELVRDDEKHKAARLFADLKAVEMTMNDNGWLSAVLDYRTRRGDYGEHLRIGAKPRWTL